METRKNITESRTTIFYMVFFGAFILTSYFFAVDPVKKQHEQVVYRMELGEAHDASAAMNGEPHAMQNQENNERQ